VTVEVEHPGLTGLEPGTTRELARRGLTEAFRAEGLPSASLDARVLTCAAVGIDHVDLVREPDRRLGAAAETLRDFARRRLCREPVSRITGVREFWGMRLEIDRHVLDPRPDTETLVEAIVDRLAAENAAPLRILDLGVGSGAILCGLLASLPNAFGIGVDVSAGACAVARRNLTRSGFSARTAILCGNWTDAFFGSFNVIVSNPPYIPSVGIASLDDEVRGHDPVLALDGGDDGLAAYRALAPRLAPRLAEGGIVAFEIGTDQFAGVAAILGAAGFEPMAPIHDLAGRDRVVLARFDEATWR
jgi:release factor glutamine methyltransferase